MSSRDCNHIHNWMVVGASLLALSSALAVGVAVTIGFQKIILKRGDPESDHQVARDLISNSVAGALNSAMMYIGDRLNLYHALKEECATPGSSTTAIVLARKTGYNQRWLRDWLAHQAAMGVLILLPGSGDDDASLQYRLPWATAEVLGNPESPKYHVSMIQTVPGLVQRAHDTLPQAFVTGLGRPYDDPDVAEGLDRHHKQHIRDVFIPKVLPKAWNGKILNMLRRGCQVADLGCGAGAVPILLAQYFPHSQFHGFEISQVALDLFESNITSAQPLLQGNVVCHDARKTGESMGDYPDQFDIAIVFDVLHDATDPNDLIHQIRRALKPGGVLLLADIPSKEGVRENLKAMAMPDQYLGYSLCLCMSCSLSEQGGAGLGTLGFPISVARKMLLDGGFESVQLLSEETIARWYIVS